MTFFVKILSVLLYGVLFYPFFACLTTEYKLVGSTLGFLYAAIRFSFTVAIHFQCESYYKGEIRNRLFIGFLGQLPTILCLLFITLRFAVLLILEVRRKWFLAINGDQAVMLLYERAVETSKTCLAAGPVVKHVKQILNPRLNRNAANTKWYIKLLHYIYKPREDFKFSTQLVSTVVVAAITVFQLFVTELYVADVLKKDYPDPSVNKDLLFDLLETWQGAFVLSAMISAIMLLHFMKSHRDHVLQLYKGQRRFAQGVFPSPPKLVLGSLRFSGYQIAYIIYVQSERKKLIAYGGTADQKVSSRRVEGHLSMGIVLWLVVFVPALFLKHIKPVREWCLERAESVMKVKTGSRVFLPSLTPPFHYVEHVLLYLELVTIAELYQKRDAIRFRQGHVTTN
ncbi:stimulated by retinoic acid gene 6 protein-like [Porites lutea]|uniref:stimulated by retinoic acid gene 6 protein-like n=1 Tax=Porites lutea TaxID=51062 RepID=UPI003CC5E9E1